MGESYLLNGTTFPTFFFGEMGIFTDFLVSTGDKNV